MRSPEIRKFSSERWVCAPHRRSVGTSIGPKVSFSLRVSAMTAVGGYRWWAPPLGDRLLLPGAWQHDRPRLVDWAVGAALLMRRTAIDEVGPFDERFFMYVEDLDWCWRARAAGS